MFAPRGNGDRDVGKVRAVERAEGGDEGLEGVRAGGGEEDGGRGKGDERAGGDVEARVSKRHLIRAFSTTHPVPSQGYVVYSTKEKLLPEHAGKHGWEIKALREAGTRVTATVEVPEVAFTGDTAADWIDRAADGSDAVAADALRAKLLICECTFVDDRCTPEDARAYVNTHVDELVERATAFENESILLIHFSARYKADEIDAALAERLPPGLRERVTPLLVGFG